MKIKWFYQTVFLSVIPAKPHTYLPKLAEHDVTPLWRHLQPTYQELDKKSFGHDEWNWSRNEYTEIGGDSCIIFELSKDKWKEGVGRFNGARVNNNLAFVSL